MMLSSRIASLATRSSTSSRILKTPLVSNQIFRTMTSLTTLPSVEVMQGFPDPKKINITDYCAGKNVIIVGLPGAFTPT
jgi:hypothetical protein